MSSTYILSWDMTGLETCINLTEIEKEEMWNTLKGTVDTSIRNKRINQLVGLIVTRARANSHRHYEVYTVDVDDSLTKDDLVEMFNASPQTSADLIRLHGRQIYTDRYEQKKVKIK